MEGGEYGAVRQMVGVVSALLQVVGGGRAAVSHAGLHKPESQGAAS